MQPVQTPFHQSAWKLESCHQKDDRPGTELVPALCGIVEGVFRYLSKKHLSRYLHEIGFRWNHRVPRLKIKKDGTKKIVMKPMPLVKMLGSVLSNASGRELRRSSVLHKALIILKAMLLAEPE